MKLKPAFPILVMHLYLSEAGKELWSRVGSIVESAAELIILTFPGVIGKITRLERVTNFVHGE